MAVAGEAEPIPVHVRTAVASMDELFGLPIRSAYDMQEINRRQARAFMVDWYTGHWADGFDQLERWLETMGSRVYLLGDDLQGPHINDRITGVTFPERRAQPNVPVDPRDGQPAEFYLEVGIKREDEQAAKLHELGITREENLARLALTGTELVFEPLREPVAFYNFIA